MKWWKNYGFWVGVITGVMLILRLGLAYDGNFNFSWDFGRDMLWVRQLTEMHKPMLVGAWGSLEGTYFGPGYFYLLAIPYLLSNGDPRAAVYMVTIFLTGLIPLGYFFGKRWFGARMGLWWAICLALMPIFTILSLYSFPQQLIPLVFLLLTACLWELRLNPKASWWFFSGFMASLIFHFEPVDTPIGYLWLMGWLLILIKNKRINLNFKTGIALLLGLVIPLIPNMFYDLRHNGGQLKALVRLLNGTDTSLGGGLSWFMRLIDRPMNWAAMFGQSLVSANKPAVGLGLVLSLGLILFFEREAIRKKLQTNLKAREFLTLLGVGVLITVIYFLIFPRLLKDYYLYFLPVITALFLGFVLEWLYRGQRLKRWAVWGLGLGLLLIQIKCLVLIKTRPNSQSYRSQLMAVQWIYNEAQEAPLKVYAYTPTVYDYPYQYLIWWLGRNVYLTLPVEYAYKPDQPEYVANKERYDQMVVKKNKGETKVYLIMEPGDHQAYARSYWRGLYPEKIKKEVVFPGGITAAEIEIN